MLFSKDFLDVASRGGYRAILWGDHAPEAGGALVLGVQLALPDGKYARVDFTGGPEPVAGYGTANSIGYIEAPGLHNGTYTVTPSQVGVTFSPLSKTATLNNADDTVIWGS